MPSRLPAIFFGHGNPMNALADNAFTRAWRRLGQSIPKPRAVLMISAHWFVSGTAVTAIAAPKTIHDFGGFPRELFEAQYKAPGDPAFARDVAAQLAPLLVTLDTSWGLDHGAWSVLCHVYPNADVPVLQLSIDETKPPSFHFELGKKLAALRDDGVLIAGSGNIVHNLEAYAWGRQVQETFDWAARFESTAREKMQAGDFAPLIDYEQMGRDAQLSIPTPEHYLPLLYVLGTKQDGEAITFPIEGVDGGSISMLSVQIG
jgi:4,5-DOPA dioxygenase extradiol